MIRLLAWYLLERLVSLPAQFFMWLHLLLVERVTKALVDARKADFELKTKD